MFFLAIRQENRFAMTLLILVETGRKEFIHSPEIPTSAGVELQLGDVCMHDEIAWVQISFRKLVPR
jgi:hypothetical protein